MIRQTLCLIAAVCALASSNTLAQDTTLETGRWYAFLATPGGRLPFHLDIGGEPGAYTAHVLNAQERVEIPIVKVEGDQLLLEFDHFDSRIEATLFDDGASFHGTWTKARGPGDPPQIKIWAYRNDEPRFRLPLTPAARSSTKLAIEGLWQARFEGSESDAVGEFTADELGRVFGTFRTPTGDYRYLEGSLFHGLLELSSFDGAHAFLFHATLGAIAPPDIDDADQIVRAPIRSMQGVFYSGSWWQEPWTAVKNVDASIPDPENAIDVDAMIDLGAISRPDPGGVNRTLAETTEGGGCIIVEIMGTWSSNCLDASLFLMQLHEQFAGEGLRIVSLAFEVTGDPERDRAQIQTYIDRIGLPFPVLYAGQSDKSVASASLPFIREVKAYPSFIVLNEHGGVVMTYSGFSGPATGAAHTKMREKFEHAVRSILSIN